MSVEILSHTPASGEFPEQHFGVHFNSRLWVKFTSNQFEEWVGCFSKSHDNGLCLAITNTDNLTAFVIAGGQGYLIDIGTRALIGKLDEHPLIESALATSNPNYFLAGTYHSIYVLNNSGLLMEIEPDMIVDGIYFKKQIAEKAIGDLSTAENQYSKNVDFEFDLITFQFKLIKPNLLDSLRKRLFD